MYDMGYCISLAACSTHVPIIVVAHYWGMAYNYSDQLNDLIQSQIEFYKYEEVIPLENTETKE